jgi:hypothetical protein
MIRHREQVIAIFSLFARRSHNALHRQVFCNSQLCSVRSRDEASIVAKCKAEIEELHHLCSSSDIREVGSLVNRCDIETDVDRYVAKFS